VALARRDPYADGTLYAFETQTPAPTSLDEERVEQILDALLDNAIRYSPDGGEIELAAEYVDGGIRFSIRDTGVGIESHHQPRIGEKFYRVDPELRRGAAGLGLGLYICHSSPRS
jgi:signal transduction histidine kinase